MLLMVKHKVDEPTITFRRFDFICIVYSNYWNKKLMDESTKPCTQLMSEDWEEGEN